MTLLLLLAPLAHVPTYPGDCENNCCEPPHKHTISQVVYLKNDGGLELHVDALKTDGDGEVIDFDVVFKKEYDLSTFEVYVGCGGCASGPDEVDPILTAPIAKPAAYQKGKLEPFTQTGYFPLLPKGAEREFDTLALASCGDEHWSIRLVAYPNATETIVWGAVVGCEGMRCEAFTFGELLSFPLYIFRNHGPTWNDYQYTIILAIVFAFLIIVVVSGLLWGGMRVLKKPSADGNEWVRSPRCFLYALGTWALLADVIETLAHYSIATASVGWDDRRGHGIFYGVLIGGRLIPLLLVLLIWGYLRAIPENRWREYKNECACGWYRGFGFYSPLWAHGGWSLLEIAGLGLAGFFWLGAGFWVWPTAMTLAGLYRFYVWCWPATASTPKREFSKEEREELADALYRVYRGDRQGREAAGVALPLLNF